MKVLTLAFAWTFCLYGEAFAQQAAARNGDLTSHPGGRIVQGSSTVFIGGQPAARVGDQVICPVVDPPLGPFDPPRPHVGGQVQTGSSTVRINGLPAARVGSTVIEIGGPPSSILPPGAPSVTIGN